MPEVVIHHAQLIIVELAAPLDGLNRASAGCDFAVGGAGIDGVDVAIRIEHLADVLCQIPAVAVPCPVFLDDQRAGGNGLRRIPRDEPQAGMVGTG